MILTGLRLEIGCLVSFCISMAMAPPRLSYVPSFDPQTPNLSCCGAMGDSLELAAPCHLVQQRSGRPLRLPLDRIESQPSFGTPPDALVIMTTRWE